MIQKRITKDVALQRLEALCVRAEHCRFELQEKLRKWGILSGEAEEILNSLEQRRFFNDSRYASAYVRDKLIYNRWGKLKITLGLRAKRIDASLISEALDEIDSDEYRQIAKEFLTAKARTVKEGFTYDGRTKLYRSGLSRGFESELVAKIVKDSAIWNLEP